MVVGIRRRVAVAELGGEVREVLMLPASPVSGMQCHSDVSICLPDEDVSRALVLVDDLLDALGVLLVARRVDGDAEVGGQRRDGVKRSLVGAI